MKHGEANPPNPTQWKILEWVDDVKAGIHPKHKRPFTKDDGIPILYIQGGVGCGKSRGYLAVAMELLTQIPGLRILWGRQDFKDLKLSIMDKFFEIMPKELIVDKSEQYSWYDIQGENGKGRIYFNGLKDLAGFGSQEFGAIVVTEAHQITKQALDTLKRRCRQEDVINIILMEGEAPNESHWLKQVTDPAHSDYDPDIDFWKLSTYENWDNLPTSYRASLEKMPASWKRKYLLGEFGFIPDGKPYYEGFHELLHVRPIIFIPQKTLYLGWDFGFHHPACLITQFDPQGRWCWLREIIGTDITIDKFGDYVKAVVNEHYPNTTCLHFGDPACIQVNDKSESTSYKILQNKGIQISYRQSEYRQRKEIIEGKLATLTNGIPALIVDPQCKTAIDGFLGGYHYPVHKEGQAFSVKFEIPFKDGFYEHIMNAGEYIGVNLFSPIKRQPRGDKKKGPRAMSNI